MRDELVEAALKAGNVEYAEVLRARAAAVQRAAKKNGGAAKVRDRARRALRLLEVPQKPQAAAAAEADAPTVDPRAGVRHWLDYPDEPGPCSACPMASRCGHYLLACDAFAYFVHRGGTKLPPRTFREPTTTIYKRIFSRVEYKDRGSATSLATPSASA